jgi:hypothetical protein
MNAADRPPISQPIASNSSPLIVLLRLACRRMPAVTSGQSSYGRFHRLAMKQTELLMKADR